MGPDAGNEVLRGEAYHIVIQVLTAGDQLGLFDAVPVMDREALTHDDADGLALEGLAVSG